MCPPDFPAAMETNIKSQKPSAQFRADTTHQSPSIQPPAQRPQLADPKKPRRSEEQAPKTRQILPINAATLPPILRGNVPALAAPCAIVHQQIPMSDPSESRPAAATRKPRRIFGIGAILLSVPIILWIGAAFFVARSLMYPEFIRRGGQDVFGQHVPAFKRGSATDIGAALGIEPELLDCGMVEEDGIRHHQVSVVGWYFPGKRRDVVVIVPAAGAPETAMIPYAKFLLGAGYTVVAAYGSNNPSYGVNWGMLKRKFALATARTLKDQLGFKKIAALGIGEGAAGVIMAQAEQPLFIAIVADSSYANLEQLFMRSPSMARLNPAFLTTVMWEAQVWFGRKPDLISPAVDAANLGTCSLLVIQNRDDKITPLADGEAILNSAGYNGQMWTVPSGGHADAIFEDPTGYAARVIKFLNASFEN
jgi:pimeloyl-ACP methyl ester carboxylesterase